MFRVRGSRFGAWRSGFHVRGSEFSQFRVSRFWVWGSGFSRFHGSGFSRFGVTGSGFRCLEFPVRGFRVSRWEFEVSCSGLGVSRSGFGVFGVLCFEFRVIGVSR